MRMRNIIAAVCAVPLIVGSLAVPALATGDGGKVGVCHRTGSESHPYVYISVPKDQASGHITGTGKQHNHKVFWKSDGTWDGVDHKAGDERLDYLAEAGISGDCSNGTTPPEEPEPTYPYEVSACWEMDNPDMSSETSLEWPQTLLDKGTKSDPAQCPPVDTCEGAKYQYDWYWIRDDADADYFDGLTVLNSPADDASLEAHDWYVVYSAPNPDRCEPTEPPVTNRHTKTRVKIKDECNCYRDKVWMYGQHVTIEKFHPSNRVWKFKVTGDRTPSGGHYLLPSKIGGHSGWAKVQWYKVKTKNQICPCRKRGDCKEKYPHFTPPADHCRTKGGTCH